MSNTFTPYTAQQVAEVALGLTKGSFRLASVVQRFTEEHYKIGRGNTVFLTVPGALTARSRALGETTTAIVLDSLTETQEPISLDNHAYSAVGLSEYDLSLGLQDFASQVLFPQTDAVADKTEATLEAVLAGIAPTSGITFDEGDPVALFTAGRAALRARGVDLTGNDLVAIVGSTVSDALLASGALDYGKTGNADALRDGSLGSIRGFTAIESGRVAADEVVFMPRNGVYLASRAPEVPIGASFGQKITQDGLSLRYLRDYDTAHTQDRSLVSTFLGAGVMPLYKIERNYTTNAATATEVAGGAVVKVDTSA